MCSNIRFPLLQSKIFFRTLSYAVMSYRLACLLIGGGLPHDVILLVDGDPLFGWEWWGNVSGHCEPRRISCAVQ
jgi:hypothetical protein